VLLVLDKTDDLSNNLKEARDDLKGILQDYIEEADSAPGDEDKPDVRTREKKGKGRLISRAKSDKKTFPGYKVHTTESENEFVTGIDVTPGNVSDDAVLPELVDDLNERGMKPKKMRVRLKAKVSLIISSLGF